MRLLRLYDLAMSVCLHEHEYHPKHRISETARSECVKTFQTSILVVFHAPHTVLSSYKEFDYFANTIWRVLAYAQMRWLELFIEMVRMICTFCEMNLVCVLFVLDLGWLFCLFYFIISLAIKLVAVTHSTRFKVLSYSTLNRIQNRQIPIHRITIGIQSFRITIFVVNRDH